jgi:hypothetical protein
MIRTTTMPIVRLRTDRPLRIVRQRRIALLLTGIVGACRLLLRAIRSNGQ